MCTADGCERDVYAQGHCERHYRQVRRTGRVRPEPPAGRPVCLVDGCDRPAKTRGWCHGHYLRWWRLGDVQADRPLGDTGLPCKVPGCGRPSEARQLCRAHYARWRATGDAQEEVPVRVTTGAGFEHHGYWCVPVPPEERWLVDGATNALEHRLVMARTLGRPLTADESVHHRNGDRLDNRPDNLELWARWQPSGQRVEDLVAHAVDVVRWYRPSLLAGDSE